MNVVYDVWYRDRRFNSALQADGSFNFAGFFKRPIDQKNNLLAIIMAGFNHFEPKLVTEIIIPCRLYVSAIQRNSAVNSVNLLVQKLYLKLEPPLQINSTAPQLYHGFEIVKNNQDIIVRRYQEIHFRGTWQIKVFGKKKSGKTEPLEELLQQVEGKEIGIKDYISKTITEYLYQLWHS